MIHSRLIAPLLLSLTLLVMIPPAESRISEHSILVPNCGTGSSSLTANLTQVSPGASGTVLFSCGPLGSAIDVTHSGNAVPRFSLPSDYSSLAISLSPVCASTLTLTSGSHILFGPGGSTIGNYNYCASYSNAPRTGLQSFQVTWSK